MKKLLFTVMFLLGLTTVSFANETNPSSTVSNSVTNTQVSFETGTHASSPSGMEQYLETLKSRRRSSGNSIFSVKNILIGALVVVIIVVGLATGTLTVNGQQV